MISAEDFCKVDGETLAAVRRQFPQGSEVTVIFTLAPFVVRAVSQWQENVKHGRTTPIEDPVFNQPQLHPTLISRMLDRLTPDEAIVVVGNRTQPPDWLIRHFLDGARLADAVPQRDPPLEYAIRTNRSFGRVEIEMIRHLNLCFEYLRNSGIPCDEAYIRRRLTRMLGSASWKAEVPRTDIALPDCWDDIHESARRHHQDISELLDSRRIRVIGEVGSILDGL